MYAEAMQLIFLQRDLCMGVPRILSRGVFRGVFMNCAEGCSRGGDHVVHSPYILTLFTRQFVDEFRALFVKAVRMGCTWGYSRTVFRQESRALFVKAVRMGCTWVIHLPTCCSTSHTPRRNKGKS